MLRCVSRYSNGLLAYQPGDFVEGLSEEQEAALEADSPGAFERVEVIRHVIAAGADAEAARAAARDAAEELVTWRKRWSAVTEVIEAVGDEVGPDALPGYLREVLAGRGALAEQVEALSRANAEQSAALESQAATLADLSAKLAALSAKDGGTPPEAAPADEPRTRRGRAAPPVEG